MLRRGEKYYKCVTFPLTVSKYAIKMVISNMVDCVISDIMSGKLLVTLTNGDLTSFTFKDELIFIKSVAAGIPTNLGDGVD